jgi:hypothetical protein
MHLGRLDMSRHGVGELTKFDNVGGGSDVNTLRRAIVERGSVAARVGSLGSWLG